MNESSSSSSSHGGGGGGVAELPGFRFHPTEEELLNFYLRSIVFGNKLHGEIIAFLNIYKHHPRELPGLARINGEREWYFFVPRDRKHGNGGRPNRTTETGFWKATGSDRKILSLSDPRKMLGAKKTLVFYEGRAPRGRKTDWIMNEYRLPDATQQQEIVLCKIYRKATSFKVLEQRASMVDHETKPYISPPPLSPSIDSMPFCDFEDVSFAGCEGWSCTTNDLQLDWNWTTLENLTSFMPMC